MKITNQDICEMLEKQYGQKWVWIITKNSSIKFSCGTQYVEVKTTNPCQKIFEKFVKDVNWAKVYKNTLYMHVKERDEWQLRKCYYHNFRKPDEFLIVLPRPIEIIIEKKLSKDKPADLGRGGK